MQSDKPPARLGRPPRVTPAQIAQAALDIGLDRATIRSVADHLGMSVPGLYHHVGTREELLAMAAVHGMGELRLPDDVGQPLSEWLTAYARFVYDALVAQPEVIGQILAGTVNTMRQAQHLEQFLAVLTARHHTVVSAYGAYSMLMAAVTGAAASEVGRAAADRAGHPIDTDLRRATRAIGVEAVPHVAELVRRRRREPDPFDAVRAVIDRIATVA